MLQAKQHAKHIGIEGGRIALRGLVDDRAGLTLGTGTIDGGVDSSKSRNGLVHQIAHLIILPDVGLDEDGFCAEAVQFGLKGLTFRIPATGHDKPGAFLRKFNGSGPTDPGQRTRNQNNWIIHGQSPWYTSVAWLAY